MSLLLKLAIGLLAAFVIICGLGLLFSARPTPILGLDPDVLGHSVAKGEFEDQDCKELPNGNWSCLITGNKRPTTYEVDVRWDGCWKGTRTAGPVTTYTPEKVSGCVDIWDHLQLEYIFK
ncbi:MAG: hypothetical protein WBW62_10530 [Solirubrobacterales bacterium]